MTVAPEAPALTPYESLTRSLQFADNSQHVWWQKVGLMMSKVLGSADGSWEEQLGYLQFFARIVLPQLGPYPRKFNSSITRSGLPVEFSINYQQNGKPPVVRVGFEPLGNLSGTAKDPFNKVPVTKLLPALSQLQISGFDLQLWDHVVKELTISEDEQTSIEGTEIDGGYLRSQTAFGFDLIGGGGVSVKGYAFPALKCKVTGKSMAEMMADFVKNTEHLVDCSAAFSMVHAYLKDKGYDDRAFLSWDFVQPSKSRLKLYTASNNVTRDKLEEAWTLGGRLQGPTVSKGLQYLKLLFDLINLEEGERPVEVAFDDSKHSSKATPLVWNYEMRAGDPNPLTKLYFPIHGENDMQIITGVAQFFRMIGLTDLGHSYVDTVKSYFPDIDLSTTERFTSWVSFAYTEKTGVYLSVYYHSSTDNPWETEKPSGA
ncbi:aromatic prenyltransferase, DMATS type [Coccidioides immitis RS]|uniref:Aromatic prenyltransferase, DMATS type n=3 Tax=Coccidioides immitis TaxID=5501 RepID=J3KA17_COCIM|nr:aromatic prenyltransferase, DMATS type [Coccidioides immitis RS]EAS31821.3 aromatic prenyltransferase, DMATS type [Coccidioides immitis RS]KMP02414.1 tryptophan dimethylallyltransferase 1 [Coccidioides immitis RMSCC 2394]KMU76684.1 tryptophan dimethylallyltransferase 1 [Coccidioides immitis RMSCC 3703]TPX24535.1 aromatic prenyltransferase (DMATS family) [Coccidioides immitis]